MTLCSLCLHANAPFVSPLPLSPNKKTREEEEDEEEEEEEDGGGEGK